MAASAAANASAAVNTDTFPGPEGVTQAIVKFLSIMMWRLRYPDALLVNGAHWHSACSSGLGLAKCGGPGGPDTGRIRSNVKERSSGRPPSGRDKLGQKTSAWL